MADMPTHIGFIIDGNRRWAKERGLKPYEGHYAGYETVKDVLIETIHRGVKYVSCYLFSTENWSCPKIEVDAIMNLLERVLINDLPIFNSEGVRVHIIGGRERMSSKLLRAIDNVERETAANQTGELLLCVNYGGQQEITDAVRQIVAAGTAPDEITPDLITQHMYRPEVPPCDMIVRTSGEQRISGFMLWRAAYSELLFIPKNWPDMTKDDVDVILKEYAKRNRRFGG